MKRKHNELKIKRYESASVSKELHIFLFIVFILSEISQLYNFRILEISDSATE